MKSCILFLRIAVMACLFQFTGLAANAQSSFRAVDDTIDLYPFVPVVYDILANDTIPAGDTIERVSFQGSNYVTCINTGNQVFTFTLHVWGLGPVTEAKYTILLESGDTSSAILHFRIHDRSFAYLDINNVKARFCANGSHFFFENADFEVPRGSGKTSIFLNTFWIGGKDGTGQLHLAGQRFGQGPGVGPANTKFDFFPGPVMDSLYYAQTPDSVWNRVWNLKKTDIDYHRAHYWEAGYVPKEDILTWPGNGNTTMGQAPKLAPFADRNADGIYDPFDGDYPEIRGDQALFFIFNDDRGPHLETGGLKLRLEIHGMAYAFDLPQDSAMKNTVFLFYKIYNRSQNTYDSTLMGAFTDIDLGYAADDFIGCDVERSMYFGYNGTPVDGNGQPNAYGPNPPAQSVAIMAGPFMDPDGIDNPRFDQYGNQLCDASINGLNFGDEVTDNERLGMQRFAYFNNSNSGVPGYMNDPTIDVEYYNLMCGRWKDGTPMIYGGNGHPTAGGYGPECRFMFPAESDSLDWGTGCTPPNGPKNWTEETALNNPQDRRGVGVTGPFSFGPGAVQELDLSFSWARDYGGKDALSSLDKLRLMVDEINRAFAENRLSNGEPFYGIEDRQTAAELPVKVYPNPASDQLFLDFSGGTFPPETTVELVTSQGKTLKRITADDRPASLHIDVSGLPGGFYFIRIETPDARVVKKVVIIR
jgi:hypothetical protein